MNTIKYKIKFHSFWNCGSGLASGADADLLVIKDLNGLPYIPGKTIKGLIREAVDLLGFDEIKYTEVFGTEGCSPSKSFFSNATFSKEESNHIIVNHLSSYLFHNISETEISDEGVANDKSLRTIQVCIPCILEGHIIHIPDSMVEPMIEGLKFIKRIGVSRNRGLGRCTIEDIEVIDEKGGKS